VACLSTACQKASSTVFRYPTPLCQLCKQCVGGSTTFPWTPWRVCTRQLLPVLMTWTLWAPCTLCLCPSVPPAQSQIFKLPGCIGRLICPLTTNGGRMHSASLGKRSTWVSSEECVCACTRQNYRMNKPWNTAATPHNSCQITGLSLSVATLPQSRERTSLLELRKLPGSLDFRGEIAPGECLLMVTTTGLGWG
jgi:hypothetical protein